MVPFEDEYLAAAEKRARRACDRDPEDAALWHELGAIRAYRRDYAGAERAFTRACSIDPERLSYWLNLSVSLRKQGKAAEADEAVLRACWLDPVETPDLHTICRMLADDTPRWVDANLKSLEAGSN